MRAELGAVSAFARGTEFQASKQVCSYCPHHPHTILLATPTRKKFLVQLYR